MVSVKWQLTDNLLVINHSENPSKITEDGLEIILGWGIEPHYLFKDIGHDLNRFMISVFANGFSWIRNGTINILVFHDRPEIPNLFLIQQEPDGRLGLDKRYSPVAPDEYLITVSPRRFIYR